LLQALTFLSFKEKKENRLAEALSETVHSPLFTLRLYANSVQKGTKQGLSRLVDTLQGFQGKVMR